jgi:hypothetical protein
MGKAITQVSLAILIAACSTGYPAIQESPGAASPAVVHRSGVVNAEDRGYFVVTLGGVPLIVTADFVPG